MSDVNFRAEYRIAYSCMKCSWRIEISTYKNPPPKSLMAICKRCGGERRFEKEELIERKPGLFQTKCWNCGNPISSRNTKRDGWYGLECDACGESLRNRQGSTKKLKKNKLSKSNKSVTNFVLRCMHCQHEILLTPDVVSRLEKRLSIKIDRKTMQPLHEYTSEFRCKLCYKKAAVLVQAHTT